MTYSLEEARRLVAEGGSAWRPVPSWATRMVEEAEGGPGVEPLVGAFVEVGLSDVDAKVAAQRLREGSTTSFAGAISPWASSRSALQGHPVDVGKLAEVAAGLGLSGQLLREHRTPSEVRSRLLESATAKAAGEGLMEVQLISEGEGSSGFYPASTLQEAARSKVFHAGLHCYLDHPTQTQEFDRPGRSVRDLAGALASDAVFRGGALHARVKVFKDFREFITERASTIGMSILAEGDVKERASASGDRRTPVIERIMNARSVDFVTKAGARGRIVSW